MSKTPLLLLALIALLAFGCSSGGDGSLTPIGAQEPATSTAENAPSTTVIVTEAPGVDTADDEDEVVLAVLETWTTLLDASASGAPNPDQLETIKALGDADTAAQMESFFPEAPARELNYHTKLTPQDDGTVAIDDCIVMNRGISTGFSNWFIGSATPNPETNTGWTIDTVQLINLDPCVPNSIAQAAIQGYEDFWDAREIYLNPPDPESPLIEETTSGVVRELYLGLAQDFADANQIVTGRPSTVPEFLSIASTTEVVIIDCQETAPGLGVYDADTGERTDFVPPMAEGQLDLKETTMILEQGRWKVDDLQAANGSQCRTPPTPPVLQLAGS